jgi:hypothetical protein
MPKTRDILVRVSVAGAIRQRKCHRSRKHQIQAGERFLLVQESNSLGSKNYCKQCAQEILDLADKKFAALRQELRLGQYEMD